MLKRIAVYGGLAVAALVVAGFVYINLHPKNSSQVLGTVTSAPAKGEYADLASQLAGQINLVSPTPPLAGSQWIAERISFIKSQPYAYIEYTDTHVTLRLLADYYTQGRALHVKVLATFIPTERGDWQLDQGTDLAQNQPTVTYKFSGDSHQWLPESK